LSNLKERQPKPTPVNEVNLGKEFETYRDLMDAYNKAQVGMFNEERDRIDDLSTLISSAISKLDSLEEMLVVIQDDLKSLAVEIDRLDETIKLVTSGR